MEHVFTIKRPVYTHCIVSCSPTCVIIVIIACSFNYPDGRLTLSKRQNAYEEESDDQAQLTNLEPSTQERDTPEPPSTQEKDIPEPPSTSVTDSDGDQSVSQKGRNSKLSTDSVDSGVGRNSSHNSLSKLSQQDDDRVVCHDLNERLLQMEQTILERKKSFAKEMDDLVDQVRSIRLQSVNSSSPIGLSNTESTNNQASSSSLILESDTGETEMEPDLKTSPDMQATPGAQSEAFTMDPLEQQRTRHYSDSKMTRYRKTEIRNKLGSVVPKALSEQIDVSRYCRLKIRLVLNCYNVYLLIQIR